MYACAYGVEGDREPMCVHVCVCVQYYQVPRLWMVGYDESRHPLTPQQVHAHTHTHTRASTNTQKDTHTHTHTHTVNIHRHTAGRHV